MICLRTILESVALSFAIHWQLVLFCILSKLFKISNLNVVQLLFKSLNNGIGQ